MIRFLTLSEAKLTAPDLPDVYYAPEYGDSAEVIDGGTWECATDGQAWFPYIKRTVEGSREEYDLVTPYGYGGVTGVDNDDALAEFRSMFLTASRERGLIAEFIRGNPFDISEISLKLLDVDNARPHRTYGVSVHADPDEYWQGAQGRHRTAVRKASKAGVVVERHDNVEVLDASSGFRTLYDLTMERVGSSARLRVGDEYFTKLRAGLGDRLVLIKATRHGQDCAASLFMSWGNRVHYHLSGSTDEGMQIGASNAILDHAIRTVVAPGMTLHLGGGVSSDDGLARFKSAMATEVMAVQLCRHVVNRQRYDQLVVESGADRDSAFFPAYRDVR
ncbi:GNAT family N-acetyltransferase [Nocardioides sp.]|uniref:GNAT family N-acetyltransferase n=1 Tax=Nocardioides sp. TaxID=35761 RepID=UPI002735CE0A|nr:GNAT family N-acetyltransferase [Nocardioides sp.]MDP3889740.1 GNAT family N-acetyltransferase [Nocardioides sp.]